MEKVDQEIYQRFIEYVSNPVIGFPESEHMMPMIKSFITPEEADFMTGFPKSATSLDKIAAMMEMEPAELLPKIKALCEKGLVYEAIRGDSVRYRLFTAMEMFLRVTFWDGKDKEPTKSMAPHVTKYYMDGWYDQLKPLPHPGLRAIPINKTIEDIGVKQIQKVFDWQAKNPNFSKDPHLFKKWNTLIQSMMGGESKPDQQKNKDLVRKQLGKGTNIYFTIPIGDSQ